MAPLIPLPGRAVLRLSGADVQSFLQGVITADARRIAPGVAVYAALLSPQGKMLADFFLHGEGEDVLLDVEDARAADLTARLKMYKLRAKVTITDESARWHCLASLGEITLPPGAIGGHDPRSGNFSTRLLVSDHPAAWAQVHGHTFGTFDQYDRARIERFLPDGTRDYIPERSFPLELGLDHLGAIDFQKGCYIGQEVTNTQKRRLARKKALGLIENPMGLPEFGTTLEADGVPIGEMRSACGSIGLALMRIEHFAESVKRGDDDVRLEMPHWTLTPA